MNIKCLAGSLCGCTLTIPLEPITVAISDIIKPNMLFKSKGKGMPIKIDDNKNLTDNEEKIPDMEILY